MTSFCSLALLACLCVFAFRANAVQLRGMAKPATLAADSSYPEPAELKRLVEKFTFEQWEDSDTAPDYYRKQAEMAVAEQRRRAGLVGDAETYTSLKDRFAGDPRPIRKNVLSLTPSELDQFTRGVLALKTEYLSPVLIGSNFSTMDQFAWTHNVGGRFGNIHKVGLTVPWHRQWLMNVELALRRVTGNDTITVPYWNFFDRRTRDEVFAENIMGGNGTGAKNKFQIASGPYAQWTSNIKEYVVRPHHRICRSFGTSEHMPPLCRIFTALSNPMYNSEPFTGVPNCNITFSAIVNGIHARVHNWLLSPDLYDFMPGADPLTMLIHSFIDKVFMMWQLYWYSDGDDGLWGYRPGWGNYTGSHLLNPLHPLWFFNNSIASVLNPYNTQSTYDWEDEVDGTFDAIVGGNKCFSSVDTKGKCQGDQSDFLTCGCNDLPAPWVP